MEEVIVTSNLLLFSAKNRNFNFNFVFQSELKLCGEARQCPSADLVGLFGNLFCGEDPIVLPMSPITLLCPNATIV